MDKKGVVSQRANMTIRLNDHQVEFRPLIIDSLSHSMNIGPQFLEKYGFNVEITKKRLYSPELAWAVPFTTRRDHVALTNTATVFKEHANSICAIDGVREMGWG